MNRETQLCPPRDSIKTDDHTQQSTKHEHEAPSLAHRHVTARTNKKKNVPCACRLPLLPAHPAYPSALEWGGEGGERRERVRERKQVNKSGK